MKFILNLILLNPSGGWGSVYDIYIYIHRIYKIHPQDSKASWIPLDSSSAGRSYTSQSTLRRWGLYPRTEDGLRDAEGFTIYIDLRMTERSLKKIISGDHPLCFFCSVFIFCKRTSCRQKNLGKICKIPPKFTGRSMVSCRFSRKNPHRETQDAPQHLAPQPERS